jgi:hypothetical protein
MAKPDTPDTEHETELQHMAADVFSSEKREDIWAIIIAVAILLCSLAFPQQLHDFFASTLYLF